METKKREEKVLVEGVDIVITLDVSNSMSDITAQTKTKLDMAKEAVTEFIQGRKHDRIGMVIFAGMGVVLCPLTHDYDLLLKFWDKSRLESLTDGTAIGKAIVTSLNQLIIEGEGLLTEPGEEKNKIIILLTDGVNNIREIMPLVAANIAKVVGIRIYTIGVGKDADEGTLMKMANLTGGKYFFITDKEGLSNAYREISELEKEKYEIKEYVSYYDLLPYFLIPAFVLFIAEVILSNTRFRKIP
jgi:Ca-activated chloride channel family protein